MVTTPSTKTTSFAFRGLMMPSTKDGISSENSTTFTLRFKAFSICFTLEPFRPTARPYWAGSTTNTSRPFWPTKQSLSFAPVADSKKDITLIRALLYRILEFAGIRDYLLLGNRDYRDGEWLLAKDAELVVRDRKLHQLAPGKRTVMLQVTHDRSRAVLG